MAEGDQTTVAAGSEAGAGGADGVPASPAAAPGGDDMLTPMETELEMVSMERDDYRRQFETVQAELAALTAASPNADTINKLQQDNDHLRKTLKKATDMLREKMTYCNVQEKKNQALTQQVTTLKEVLQVTRDLLNIRNTEVEQLQKNVDSMESRIDENRRRQSAMIKQMEQATKINGELRNEYETQLRIFQSLKERYEEKVTALTNLANQRERHNSEGSEKFEDAPDGSEAANASEVGNASEVENEVQPVSAQGAAMEPTAEGTQGAVEETKAEGVQRAVEEPKAEGVQRAVEEPKAEGVQRAVEEPKPEGTQRAVEEPKVEGAQGAANTSEIKSAENGEDAGSAQIAAAASQSNDTKESSNAPVIPAPAMVNEA